MKVVGPRLEPGTVFAGDYVIVRPLSKGGMGTVYVAEQRGTGALRALKLMNDGLLGDPRSRKLFAQEARVGARIESDHVVQVVDAGFDEASRVPWLAMELLKGEDLAAYVARSGGIPPVEAQEILAQLCHALGAAHRAAEPIVHRDLKPENVFLAASRQEGIPFMVKLLDFGIAKVVADAIGAGSTMPVGTPLWMAPEQTEVGTPITPATDVWALGLIVFRMLTARYYWRIANEKHAPHAVLLREVVAAPLAAASERAAAYGLADRLPSGFDAWFERCVARDPRQRFADAGVARIALDEVLPRLRSPVANRYAPPGAPPPAMAAEPATRSQPREADAFAATAQYVADRGIDLSAPSETAATVPARLPPDPTPPAQMVETGAATLASAQPPPRSRAAWILIALLATLVLAGGAFLLVRLLSADHVVTDDADAGVTH